MAQRETSGSYNDHRGASTWKQTIFNGGKEHILMCMGGIRTLSSIGILVSDIDNQDLVKVMIKLESCVQAAFVVHQCQFLVVALVIAGT
eukprot:11108856-Ditylum_brightwellii.AAC.1